MLTKEKLKEKFYEALMKSLENILPMPYNDNFDVKVAQSMFYMLKKPVISTSYRCNLALEKELNMDGEEHVLPCHLMVESECSDESKIELMHKIDTIIKKIDIYKTYKSIIEFLDKNNITYILYRNFYHHYIILEDLLIALEEEDSRSFITFTSETGETPDWFESCLVYKELDDEKNTYEYVVRTPHGFRTRQLNVNDMKVNIDTNYNDDIPDKEIKEFLTGDKSGIVILHGEPGTGKSTYIRHLIANLDKDFLYLDASCFNYLTDASFIEMLFDNKGSIVILEDAEKILKKRTDNDFNNQVSPLLNLTDGLLGDSLKLKVVCTFNAPLNNIDDAILRKGRLKVKYLFNKLNVDKTNKLLESLGVHNTEMKEQTLADIYNYAEKNDFGEKKKKSVGF